MTTEKKSIVDPYAVTEPPDVIVDERDKEIESLRSSLAEAQLLVLAATQNGDEAQKLKGDLQRVTRENVELSGALKFVSGLLREAYLSEAHYQRALSGFAAQQGAGG